MIFKRLFGGKPDAPAAPEGVIITARLNAKVQPMDRHEQFEDPLDQVLTAQGLGAVTGGGTQLMDPPHGIAFCDVEIELTDLTDEALDVVIATLEKAGAPKGSRILFPDDRPDQPFGQLDGLGMFLNGTDLPDEVYANSDVNEIIAEANRRLEGLGSMLGYWEGPQETALFFYGKDFEQMRRIIEDYIPTEPSLELTRIEQIT